MRDTKNRSFQKKAAVFRYVRHLYFWDVSPPAQELPNAYKPAYLYCLPLMALPYRRKKVNTATAARSRRPQRLRCFG